MFHLRLDSWLFWLFLAFLGFSPIMQSDPLIKATESHYIPFFKIELLLEYAAIQLTIS
jgi:hypothetical protein